MSLLCRISFGDPTSGTKLTDFTFVMPVSEELLANECASLSDLVQDKTISCRWYCSPPHLIQRIILHAKCCFYSGMTLLTGASGWWMGVELGKCHKTPVAKAARCNASVII